MNSQRGTPLGLPTLLRSRQSTILVLLKRSNMLLMMPRLHSMRCSLAPMTLRRHLHKMRVQHKLSNKHRKRRRNSNNKRLNQLKQSNLGLQLLNLMKTEMLLSNHKSLLPQLSQLQLMSRLLHLRSLRSLKLQDTCPHLLQRRISLSLNQSNP